MPLSRALAYNLVEENFSELLPPTELEMLTPYFVAAKKSIERFSVKQAAKLDKAKYQPYSSTVIREPVNRENHKAIFDAIENHQVIKATYCSIQQGIPEDIYFSPQQIRVQYNQTQVVGLVHNAKVDNSLSEEITQVSKEVIYRHLTINRFSNIEVTNEYEYETKHQPLTAVQFSAFIHPWVKNHFLAVKLAEDQNIIDWPDFSDEDKKQCLTMQEDKPELWSKITATIELPEAFLNSQEELDAWFFANSISHFGADMLVTSPMQIVREIKRRIESQYKAYLI